MTENINDTNLKPPDPIEGEYEDGSSGQVILPPRGAYTLLPTAVPEFGATKEGYLQANVTPLVVLDPGKGWDGHEIRFTRVNTKKWPQRNANGFADYLRSHGYQGVPRSNEEYRQAAESLTNHPAHGVVDWECYCKVCRYTLKGMEKFPKRDDGTYVQIINCPNCSTAEQPVRLFANARVVAFTPPTAK